MNEQTQPLSEEEVKGATLTDEEVRNKLGRLAYWRNQQKTVRRNERIMKKILAKQVDRVLKPKPKRKPKERVTIVRIDGQPVEGLENAFTTID